MNVAKTLRIAIIGSGPSGCFLAEILTNKLPQCKVTLYERLDEPFGLAVSGVAPDHLHTRKITEQFNKTLQKENVELRTHCEVGKDITYAELKAQYDEIIFATGASIDKRLGIPGEDLPGVYGSGLFSRWYNNHQDTQDFTPQLGTKIAIIGNGNVALDIARLLAKTEQELHTSALSDRVKTRLCATAVEEIYIIGRRGPQQASFTLAELSELGELQEALPVTYAPDFEGIENSKSAVSPLPPSQQRMLEKLQTYQANIASAQESATHKTTLHFIFHHTPVSIEAVPCEAFSAEAVTSEAVSSEAFSSEAVSCEGVSSEAAPDKLQLTLETASGQKTTLMLDNIITAIGYSSAAIPDVPFDAAQGRFLHQEGQIEPHVYCLGWAKRGPQGVIPTNRSDAMALAKTIIAKYAQ